MADRVTSLGRGAYIYKSDISRGYRQLRVDPSDWPLLGFTHNGRVFMDICPPFGLRTSAMFMQRTTQAVCFIHARRGYLSRAYLEDFDGTEAAREHASRALQTLQDTSNYSVHITSSTILKHCSSIQFCYAVVYCEVKFLAAFLCRVILSLMSLGMPAPVFFWSSEF